MPLEFRPFSRGFFARRAAERELLCRLGARAALMSFLAGARAVIFGKSDAARGTFFGTPVRCTAREGAFCERAIRRVGEVGEF